MSAEQPTGSNESKERRADAVAIYERMDKKVDKNTKPEDIKESIDLRRHVIDLAEMRKLLIEENRYEKKYKGTSKLTETYGNRFVERELEYYDKLFKEARKELLKRRGKFKKKIGKGEVEPRSAISEQGQQTAGEASNVDLDSNTGEENTEETAEANPLPTESTEENGLVDEYRPGGDLKQMDIGAINEHVADLNVMRNNLKAGNVETDNPEERIEAIDSVLSELLAAMESKEGGSGVENADEGSGEAAPQAAEEASDTDTDSIPEGQPASAELSKQRAAELIAEYNLEGANSLRDFDVSIVAPEDLPDFVLLLEKTEEKIEGLVKKAEKEKDEKTLNDLTGQLVILRNALVKTRELEAKNEAEAAKKTEAQAAREVTNYYKKDIDELLALDPNTIESETELNEYQNALVNKMSLVEEDQERDSGKQAYKNHKKTLRALNNAWEKAYDVKIKRNPELKQKEANFREPEKAKEIPATVEKLKSDLLEAVQLFVANSGDKITIDQQAAANKNTTAAMEQIANIQDQLFDVKDDEVTAESTQAIINGINDQNTLQIIVNLAPKVGVASNGEIVQSSISLKAMAQAKLATMPAPEPIPVPKPKRKYPYKQGPEDVTAQMQRDFEKEQKELEPTSSPAISAKELRIKRRNEKIANGEPVGQVVEMSEQEKKNDIETSYKNSLANAIENGDEAKIKSIEAGLKVYYGDSEKGVEQREALVEGVMKTVYERKLSSAIDSGDDAAIKAIEESIDTHYGESKRGIEKKNAVISGKTAILFGLSNEQLAKLSKNESASRQLRRLARQKNRLYTKGGPYEQENLKERLFPTTEELKAAIKSRDKAEIIRIDRDLSDYLGPRETGRLLLPKKEIRERKERVLSGLSNQELTWMVNILNDAKAPDLELELPYGLTIEEKQVDKSEEEGEKEEGEKEEGEKEKVEEKSNRDKRKEKGNERRRKRFSDSSLEALARKKLNPKKVETKEEATEEVASEEAATEEVVATEEKSE